MRVMISVFGLLVSSFVFAADVQTVDLQKDFTKQKITHLYEAAVPTKSLSPLARLKDDEIHLRWNECLKDAPGVYKKQTEVRGWVALTWLHCLEKAQQKKKDLAAVESVVNQLEKNSDLFFIGPWSNDLWQQWAGFQLSVLENKVSKKDKKAGAALDRLLGYPSRMTSEQRSLAYQLLGDLALARTNYPEALAMFQQASDAKENKYVSEKIEFLKKALNKNTETAAKSTSDLSGDEEKLEARIQQGLKNGEAVAAIKDLVSLLNQYPGSQAARRWKDKPLEVYNGISDAMASSKALNEMSEADISRLLDWAQNLHRRGDYQGAMTLAKKIAEKAQTSPAATSALWISGRCAHFLGQYDQALESFSQLMKLHAGSEEASEAFFRSALIYYRKKEFSTSAALLEKLLSRNVDRYDLLAQYWLVRSLEQVNKDRAKKASAELVAEYPFSYYGLRLSAEANNGKLLWPEQKDKVPTLDHQFFLVGTQKKAWNRFVILSQAGWVGEAQSEWNQIPSLKDPTLQIKMAEFLASRDQYMLSIRLLNAGMEADPRLRREEFVKIGYPKIYENLYNEQAQRYEMDATLLRSLTRQESAFNLRAISTSNAMGLMQMIPPTAQEIAKKLGLKIELPDDMFRPEINIPMGSFYVSQMLGQFKGSIPFALAAYNAGPYRLKNWIEGRDDIKSLPEKGSLSPEDELWFDELPWTETSFYVKAILRNILIYKMAEDKNSVNFPAQWADLLKKKAK
ncbi:transglycosylase SLT domain-containing protein [Bdellovibrio sp. HCB2-146]|uniref:transglycosylase SLT domain-containing protein n=1 Tax=Bdellovibrio sp. HCB2-146 TaxID=3394362 RepID=UPI0039BC38C8